MSNFGIFLPCQNYPNNPHINPADVSKNISSGKYHESPYYIHCIESFIIIYNFLFIINAIGITPYKEPQRFYKNCRGNKVERRRGQTRHSYT